MARQDEHLHLTWTEQAAAILPPGSGREGFGTTLEKAALQGLKGDLSRNWRPEGLQLRLVLPLHTLES